MFSMKVTLDKVKEMQAQLKDTVGERPATAEKTRVLVGMATCGIAAGARPVMLKFMEEINKREMSNVTVSQTGCIGMCRLEPMVDVYMPGKEKVTYVHMTPEKVGRVVAEHIVNGRPVTEFTIGAAEE